jgi:hypothetical protein
MIKTNPFFSSVKDWVNSGQVDDIAGLNCSAEVTNRSRSINIGDTDARSPNDLKKSPIPEHT